MRITKRLSPFLRILLLPSKTMRKLYDWTLNWSRTRHAKIALFFLAFTESSFFPIPPDVLLIAMTVAHRFKWWLYAMLATAGSVLGGIAGYYIGVTLFASVGKSIIEFYHFEKAFEAVAQRYEQNALITVFTAAFTPIPYKVFTIAGGVFRIPLEELIIGSLLGRAGRFFAVAGALRIFGKGIANVIEKYFDALSFLFMALLIGGFLIIKFLQ